MEFARLPNFYNLYTGVLVCFFFFPLFCFCFVFFIFLFVRFWVVVFTWQAGVFCEMCVLNSDDSDAGLSLGLRQFYGDEEEGEGNEYRHKVMVFHLESHQASFALVQHRKQVGWSVVTTGLTNSNKKSSSKPQWSKGDGAAE